MIDLAGLTKAYMRYGFDEKKTRVEGVRVFTLRSGHFHNADIILTDKSKRENLESAYNDFAKSGFACTRREYESIEDAEQALFQGFFSVDSTRDRLSRDYKKYTDSVVKIHSEEANYAFIKTDYFINGRKGTEDVVTEIVQLLDSPKPTLFLVEAAAGFGKTSTAYELLKNILDSDKTKIPLFSELSRNRQAKILRYVLLDEIDRMFPILNAKLVNTEIQNGNVPVILDGFDELLHDGGESEGYDKTEPMLDTIGELLKNRAKLVLTTRRTVIFDGDEFSSWTEAHESEFEIVKIKIEQPTLANWLPPDRLAELNNASIPVDRIANPVILSYLRCIPDEQFKEVIELPDTIVDKFFDSMLDREQTRQDLRMPPIEQYSLLIDIAKDMMSLNYTSETREYIIEQIREYHDELLDNVRSRYPSDSKPTKVELLNKLASHALLDRSSDKDDTIRFVNEFVQGNFCAEALILNGEDEWTGDARFIEPMVTSYVPRSKAKRLELWNVINFNLEFGDAGENIKYTISLLGQYDRKIEGQSIQGITISDTFLGENELIVESLFMSCTFSRVQFNRSNLVDVTFANCHFYQCSVGLEDSRNSDNIVHAVGCVSAEDEFLESLVGEIESEVIGDEAKEAERYVLEKFWPVGKPTFHKHRPISAICSRTKRQSYASIVEAIESLKKQGILVTPVDQAFLEFNKQKLKDACEILERNV